MQHGWRWQRSTFRSVRPPLAARWAGMVPRHCFTLRSLKLLSCPRKHLHLLVLLCSLSWSLHHGEHPRVWSEPCRMSPFLTYHIPHRDSYHVPVTGSVAVFIQVLCRPWFLFQTMPRCLPHPMLVSAVLEWRSE